MQRMLYEKIRRQDGVAQGSKEAMSLHSPSPLASTREKREKKGKKMDKDRGERTKKNGTLKKKTETCGEKCQGAIKRKMK